MPDTFHEFWLVVRDLPAFAASFILLMVVWIEHHSDRPVEIELTRSLDR